VTQSPGAAMTRDESSHDDGSPGSAIRRHGVFLVLAVVSGAVLVFLARRTTFWQDEWGVVDYQRPLADILQPLNEHWSTIPILLYRATFSIVGLHSYLPYIAQVILLHLVAVAAAYVLMIPRIGRLPAAIVSIPLLLLGAGAENLFWAFQTGFVGSVAFGLWAIVLLERSGRWSLVGASVLLILSLMCSGIGLVMVGAAVARTVLDPIDRRRFVATIPPIAVYVVWFFAYGRGGVRAGQFATPGQLVAFVRRGLEFAVGGMSGLAFVPFGTIIAVGVFVVACAVTAWGLLRASWKPMLAAASLFAILVEYGVIGLTRANLPGDFANRSRYVYIAAFFIVLAVADWIPNLRAWAGEDRTRRAVVGAGLVAVLIASLAANAIGLRHNRAIANDHADRTRAAIAFDLSPQLDASWVDPAARLPGMPDPGRIRAIVAASGSPLSDALFPMVAPKPSARAVETTLLLMLGSNFRAEPSTGSGTAQAFQVPAELHDISLANGTPDCVHLDHAGPDASAMFTVPGGDRLRVTAEDKVDASVAIGKDRPPSRTVDLPLAAGSAEDVVVPDLGDGSMFGLKLSLPSAGGTTTICRVAPA
jgi:hypothetical protein